MNTTKGTQRRAAISPITLPLPPGKAACSRADMKRRGDMIRAALKLNGYEVSGSAFSNSL